MKEKPNAGAVALQELTKVMPLAMRLTVKSQIELLQKLVKSTDNLFIDYRTLRPKLSAEYKARRALEKKAADPGQYILAFRGEESEEQLSLEEAAARVRLTPGSLQAYVSKNIRHSCTARNSSGNDDVATIYRCHPDGSPVISNEDWKKAREVQLLLKTERPAKSRRASA